METSTLKNLLQTALLPVGATMYVWGGGWNEEDTGAGKAGVTLGISPSWKHFFEGQGAGYDYRKTRCQRENGLDCSGYVGWCIYNIISSGDGEEGYVMAASRMAKSYAKRGWGIFHPPEEVKDYRAGDIMSSSDHVWIAVGSCSDGSVLLLHSSPPGVQLAGTPPMSEGCVTGEKFQNLICEGEESRATALAKKYMKTWYPRWYRKYPGCAKNSSYLTDYGQMRWDVSGRSVMSDPEGYGTMSADEILKDLFEEKDYV